MFKHFGNIATLDPAVALALILTAPETPVGRRLFSAFPEALANELVPLPYTLISKIQPFGLSKVCQVLSRNQYPIRRIEIRNHVGFSDSRNPISALGGLTLAKLVESERRKTPVQLQGVAWIPFFLERTHPAPPGIYSEDYVFYCAAPGFILLEDPVDH